MLSVGCWLLVSGRFSANGFPRIVFREEECLAVVIVGVCDRRLLSLVILDILASRPSQTLAVVVIHGEVEEGLGEGRRGCCLGVA